MNAKWCPNGHCYDADRFAVCPYCDEAERKQPQRYIPEVRDKPPAWLAAMEELPRLYEAEQAEEMEAYRDHFRSLPKQVQAYMLYEMALHDTPMGRSGSHMRLSGGVFWPCAWARTKPVEGVSFGIDRACFAGRDPLLFFVESFVKGGETLAEAKGWPAGWAGEVWKTIEGCSSGIQVEGMRGRVVLFRFREWNIRKLDILYGGPGAKEQPDYVFTWPGAGEFQCTLGEVLEDRLVPLHRDDFCMK